MKPKRHKPRPMQIKAWLIAQIGHKRGYKNAGGNLWCLPNRTMCIELGLYDESTNSERGKEILHRAYMEAKWSRAPLKVKKSVIADFYKSPAWRELRYEALLKYGCKCMACGSTPESGAILHVDHIKPRSKFPHLRLDINNLQILCEPCNMGKSNKDETDFRPTGVQILKLVA